MQRTRVIPVVTVLLIAACAAFASADEHSSPSPDQAHRFPTQVVEVADFEADGWVLASAAGFELALEEDRGAWFRLVARKPEGAAQR